MKEIYSIFNQETTNIDRDKENCTNTYSNYENNNLTPSKTLYLILTMLQKITKILQKK